MLWILEQMRMGFNEGGIKIIIHEDDENGKIIIDEDGLEININKEDENFEMKIDEDGIKIKRKDKKTKND